MKISVALCTYNGAKYIEEQIKSILNQTYVVNEIVIGDDKSTDNTLDIIKNLLINSNIDLNIIENENNLGFKKNFYNTISRCKGDIIFFSDQDDVWDNNKVKKTIEIFQQNPNALLVFSNAYVTDENLNVKSYLFDSLHYKKEFMENPMNKFKYLLADNYVTGATTAIRKELIKMCHPIPLEIAHDYWFAIVASLYDGLYSIEEPLISYRQHNSNTIGINNKVDKSLIKKLFSKKKDNKNNDNLYAELRLPLLVHLKDFIAMKKMDKSYMQITDNFYVFWKKRENFANNNLLRNILIVLKDAVKKEQYYYRNTDKPILKDLVKAIAVSGREK